MKKQNKVFTLKIDQSLDIRLASLQRFFGKQNKADVFRLAIELLNKLREAEEKGGGLYIIDGEQTRIKLLLIG
jgi:hypothetical protein